jgi:hypothetical protein
VAFEVPLVLAETAATEPLAEVNGETNQQRYMNEAGAFG